MSPADLSVTANITIVLGYLFAAVYVGPRITGTSLLTRIAGGVFFATCGAHHAEAALHTALTPDLAIQAHMTTIHMLGIDTVQAAAIWVFMLGLVTDLGRALKAQP